MMVDYDDDDDDAEAACLQKLHDILLERPPGGRRRNDGPAEIVEHVYLGSMVDALDVRLLRRLRITHVLNCAPSAVRRYADSLRVPVDDCPTTWLSDTISSAEQRASAFCYFTLWSPYGIGQAIIFLPCGFFLLLSFFLA